MVRLFVAIETPDAARRSVVTLQESLRTEGADVKWESPDKLHITVKFLGDTDEKRLSGIADVLREAASRHSSCIIRYAGLGCFPDFDRPKVIWVGVDKGREEIIGLQKSVEAQLTALGFRREERPFHPHVTMGRVRSVRGWRSLRSRLESSTFECQPVAIRHFALIRSELRSTGSVYTTLHSFSLSP